MTDHENLKNIYKYINGYKNKTIFLREDSEVYVADGVYEGGEVATEYQREDR